MERNLLFRKLNTISVSQFRYAAAGADCASASQPFVDFTASQWRSVWQQQRLTGIISQQASLVGAEVKVHSQVFQYLPNLSHDIRLLSVIHKQGGDKISGPEMFAVSASLEELSAWLQCHLKGVAHARTELAEALQGLFHHDLTDLKDIRAQPEERLSAIYAHVTVEHICELPQEPPKHSLTKISFCEKGCSGCRSRGLAERKGPREIARRIKLGRNLWMGCFRHRAAKGFRRLSTSSVFFEHEGHVRRSYAGSASCQGPAACLLSRRGFGVKPGSDPCYVQ
jgi:hypothetical protein